MKEKFKKTSIKIKNIIIKFINLCKKNYIVTASVCAFLLILFASLIIIGLLKLAHNKIDYSSRTIDAYQFFKNEKQSFKTKIHLENNKIVSFDNQNSIVGGVIYAKDEVIIPKASSIVLLDENEMQYKLNKYSEIIYKNDSYTVVGEGKKNREYNFFVYDGIDTYFFPEESSVVVNGVEYNLSKLSYIEVNNMYALIYDFESDTLYFVENNIESVSVKYKDITIDAYNDIIVDGHLRNLLKNIDSMITYKEVNNG